MRQIGVSLFHRRGFIMKSFSRQGVLLVALNFALSGPSFADTSSASAPKKPKDPNEVICEKQEILGSRLAFRKVCMTRAQWAEQRAVDRQLIEQSQLGSCVKRAGC
jgi:predicted secreted protein